MNFQTYFTFKPLEYDIFAGLDVSKRSISATYVSHDGYCKSLKMPYSAANLIAHVARHSMRTLLVLFGITTFLLQTVLFADESVRLGTTVGQKYSRPEVLERISREASASVPLTVPRAADRAFAEAKGEHNREQGWIRRHPVIFGTLVGFGTGFVVGYATAKPTSTVNQSTARPIIGCFLGGIGAGVGAAIGWITTRD